MKRFHLDDLGNPSTSALLEFAERGDFIERTRDRILYWCDLTERVMQDGAQIPSEGFAHQVLKMLEEMRKVLEKW